MNVACMNNFRVMRYFRHNDKRRTFCRVCETRLEGGVECIQVKGMGQPFHVCLKCGVEIAQAFSGVSQAEKEEP